MLTHAFQPMNSPQHSAMLMLTAGTLAMGMSSEAEVCVPLYAIKARLDKLWNQVGYAQSIPTQICYVSMIQHDLAP